MNCHKRASEHAATYRALILLPVAVLQGLKPAHHPLLLTVTWRASLKKLGATGTNSASPPTITIALGMRLVRCHFQETTSSKSELPSKKADLLNAGDWEMGWVSVLKFSWGEFECRIL